MIKYLKHVASKRDCILYDRERETLTRRGHGEQLIWLNKVKDRRDADATVLAVYLDLV